jgi:pyruvate/2-oxoglutarate dehydrogenase complex dihydrolipoamide dehydrogenase (E3) component
MPAAEYDLVIIGAGSGGLTAAAFAAKLGAKVALIEKDKIGGDCTWTGCVPSKALLRAAKAAHEIRAASRFGILALPPKIEMANVRAYVRRAIEQVYRMETPDELCKQGVEVVIGAAHFVNATTVAVEERLLRAKFFLLTTGAKARIPSISGLTDVPFFTYENLFENDQLPPAMTIVGAGPIGVEIAQAYQRLGAEVTMVAPQLLPRDEPEAREAIQRILEREGVRFVRGRAQSVRKEREDIVLRAESDEVRGQALFVATGRAPNVDGLELQKAGVSYSKDGIPVDDQLRTNAKHIYAAGDVTGGQQFTHLAGWQAFQAVRNALLPGSSSGKTDLVPWVTFTDPEVAHVGLTEEQARAQFRDNVFICRRDMSQIDRAICEGDEDGFIKVTMKKNGQLLGATVVNARAGEMMGELVLAIQQNAKISDLAAAIHPYPTYSTGLQQLAVEAAIEEALSGVKGHLIRAFRK